MSYDLVLPIVKKNWSRESLPLLKPVVATKTKLVLTAVEKARLSQLAALKSKAESGNSAAGKEWRKTVGKVVALRVRAKGGDARAVRACQVLEGSGLFGKVSVSGKDLPRKKNPFSDETACREPAKKNPFSTDDSLGAFVGDEERTEREAGLTEQRATARVRGAYSTQLLGQWRDRGRRRRRHLQQLVRRSARGDAAATAKLQQVTARLSQRAATGDTRASSVLQQIQSMTSRAQSVTPTATPYYPYSTTVPGVPQPLVPGPLIPAMSPPPGAPPAAPPPVTYPTTAQTSYATPYEDDYDSY